MTAWHVTLWWPLHGGLGSVQKTVVIPYLDQSTIMWAVHEAARQAGAPLAEVERVDCYVVRP